jgi:hypothetical protein
VAFLRGEIPWVKGSPRVLFPFLGENVKVGNKRLLGRVLLVAIVILTVAVGIFYIPKLKTANASEVSDESTQTLSVVSSETANSMPVVKPAPVSTPQKPKYRAMPKIKRGMKKATVSRLMKKYGYRVQYKYTYGKKNVVIKTALPTYWKKYPQRKWSKARHRFLYNGSAKLIVTLGNGKAKPRPWHTGTATWYSIADNTPASSTQTSTGRPLGSFRCNDPSHKGRGCYGVPFTFAKGRSGLDTGDRILIEYRGRRHVAVCTDRGGLETIDLYKPGSDWFGMGGMASFKYVKLKGHWHL